MSPKLNLDVRKNFPILKGLVYLDSAATSQKPISVINKFEEHYKKKNANIHRGLYKLSQTATEEYEAARREVSEFINSNTDEIIFTRGATESLNLLAYTIKKLLGKRKEILLTELEHHANIIPWQELAKREGLKIKYVKITKDYELDYADLKNKLTKNTGLFSFTMMSNVLGTEIDAKKCVSLAHSVGALAIIDAAQAIAHKPIDVKDLDCDFLVFSGHKMLGPSGTGILYGKHDLLEKLPPFHFGGDMIKEVSYETAAYASPPTRFEAGTPNIEGAIALGEAIRYLKKFGMKNISEHDEELRSYCLKRLKDLPVVVYAPKKGAGIISFNLKNTHCHDVAGLLDDYNVCVRAGHHCAMPLMNKLGLSGTVRVSFYLYNSKDDVDKLIDALKKVVKILR